MGELLKKRCANCKPGTPALTSEAQNELAPEVPEWKVVDGKRLQREFKFPSYAASIAWVQKVAEIADQENHHPDIHIFYRKVTVVSWTHTVNGLSENDYILAAKIDAISLP